MRSGCPVPAGFFFATLPGLVATNDCAVKPCECRVVQGGTVGKLKVTHLKQALSARGLKVTGTKDVLLERLQNYLSERG